MTPFLASRGLTPKVHFATPKTHFRGLTPKVHFAVQTGARALSAYIE